MDAAAETPDTGQPIKGSLIIIGILYSTIGVGVLAITLWQLIVRTRWRKVGLDGPNNKSHTGVEIEMTSYHIAAETDADVRRTRSAESLVGRSQQEEAEPMCSSMSDRDILNETKTTCGGGEIRQFFEAMETGTIKMFESTYNNPDTCDGMGWGLLHIAAYKGPSRVVQELIDKGLDVNLQCDIWKGEEHLFLDEINERLTPLALALKAKNKENIYLLVKKSSFENIKICLLRHLSIDTEVEFFNNLCEKNFLPVDVNEMFECMCEQFGSTPNQNKSNVVPCKNPSGQPIVIVYSDKIGRQYIKDFSGIVKIVFKSLRDVDKEALILREYELNTKSIDFIPIEQNISKVKSVIKANSNSLWKNHSNLSMISGSTVKSKGKGSSVTPCECIVLYCVSKGFIPCGEPSFPDTLQCGDKITLPVDVREGYFELGVRYDTSHGYDEHKHLKMGCNISATNFKVPVSGTLGPFVKIDNTTTGVGFLTCAHVVYENIINEFEPDIKPYVFQPCQDSSAQRMFDHCGEVKKAVFKKEVDGVDVDAAAVEITDPRRLPQKGLFALNKIPNTEEFNKDTYPIFNNGLYLQDLSGELAATNPVLKVGCETHLTMGQICVEGTEVKVQSIGLGLSEYAQKVVMKGQFEVCSHSDMFINGDSGSGVFIMDLSDVSLKCIGMAIGSSPRRTMVVTPIAPILKALELTELMKFQCSKPEHEEMDVDEI